MESQSSLKKSIKEGGLCVGPVKHLLVGDKNKNKNKNKKFIVDPNTNSYIIQIHQINQ